RPLAPNSVPKERAFLVGLEYRSRAGSKGVKSSLTAAAQAARDTSALALSKTPRIPEFSAEESLDELRALAASAGAEIAGEFLRRRDRPDPATLIGRGKLEETAVAAGSGSADLLLVDHDRSEERRVGQARLR